MERFSVPPLVQLVRAIYDYQGENNDELCIRVGDVITVTQTPDGGWFEGTLNGITGWCYSPSHLFITNFVLFCHQVSLKLLHCVRGTSASVRLTFDERSVTRQ